MKGQTQLFLVLFLVIVVSVVSGIVILNYNGLVKAEKAVEEAKAQIATVCQRRLDLMPNLIDTVKGYARHERETLLTITQTRAQAAKILQDISRKATWTEDEMKRLDASQAEIGKTLRNIFALVENYPDLKASTNFLALQDQFEGTENRIAVARQRYNSAVRYYNAKINTFPGVFLAPMFGYTEKVFFEAKPAAMEPVMANFNLPAPSAFCRGS